MSRSRVLSCRLSMWSPAPMRSMRGSDAASSRESRSGLIKRRPRRLLHYTGDGIPQALVVRVGLAGGGCPRWGCYFGVVGWWSGLAELAVFCWWAVGAVRRVVAAVVIAAATATSAPRRRPFA